MECTPNNPCLNGGVCDAATNSCVCTGGLVYQTSGPRPPTCQDPFPPEGTFEGCVCPPGLFLNDSGACVPPLECFGEFRLRRHAVMLPTDHQCNHTVNALLLKLPRVHLCCLCMPPPQQYFSMPLSCYLLSLFFPPSFFPLPYLLLPSCLRLPYVSSFSSSSPSLHRLLSCVRKWCLQCEPEGVRV